jgi:predicted amino acid dehydrogenase
MVGNERRILMVEFIREEGPKHFELRAKGLLLHIERYRLGLDFDAAERLLKQFDGTVDAIVISGIPETATYGDSSVSLHPVKALRAAVSHTPLFDGGDLERMFAHWTLSKVERAAPETFRGRKALFHSVLFTPYAHLFESFGCRVSAADPLFLLNRRTRLRSPFQIHAFRSLMTPAFSTDILTDNHHLVRGFSERANAKLAEWVAESDIFVTYGHILHGRLDAAALSGKVLIVDHLSERQRKAVRDAGVAEVIELLPEVRFLEGTSYVSFALLTAVCDILRRYEGSTDSPLEYALGRVQAEEVVAVPPRVTRPIPRRCAFVIHPLSRRQLVGAKGLQWLQKLPRTLSAAAESAIALAPLQKVGQLRGARSAFDGQEVICDLYAMPATPRRILKMRSDLLYERLADAATRAQEEGSVLMGLGAYTKVAGDAGVTVARLSPIPITTGNSYSASATLWAAYEMVQKLALVPVDDKGCFQGTAMVVGATGSIGRVCALLLAERFNRVVLVAPRAEKLLELKEEIVCANPSVEITLHTSANSDLPICDLVITATSNTKGDTLDIMRVKPGAVICDCSRPLDIRAGEAAKRPDVMVIESGEIDLPGDVQVSLDLGLPKSTVYACLAETIILTMEGRYEPFSLSRTLCPERVKEIHQLGLKHGARLAPIQSQSGAVGEERVAECRTLALERLRAI